MGYLVKVTRSQRSFTDVARALGLPLEDTAGSPITQAEWKAVLERHADLPVSFDKGEIVAKTPPPKLVDKLAAIARELDAYVIGEEGAPSQLAVAQQSARCCRPWGIDETLVTAELLELSERLTAVRHGNGKQLASLRASAANLSAPEARALTALILAEAMNKDETYFLEDGVELPRTLAGLDVSTGPMLLAAMQAPARGIAALAKAALRDRKGGRMR